MAVNAVRVQLDEHSRRLDALERTEPAVIANQVKELRADVHDLRDEVKANKRAQWALASAIVVGAVSVALTALQIAGPG